MNKQKSVFDIVMDRLSTLTPNEKKIAQLLISDYPANGLRSIPQFSKSAGTSHPTVLRFVQKIGFKGYPDFQEALRGEVKTRFKTLPERYEDFTDKPHNGSEYQDYIQNSYSTLDKSLTGNNKAKIKKIAELLSKETKRVFVISGMMTKHIGVMCASHINFIRPNVNLVHSDDNQAVISLDIKKGDVVIAIDMPRYEKNIAHFTAIAKEQGASVILITDDTLSSGAVGNAAHILTNKIQAPSPFDTYLGCIIQIELIVVELILKLKKKFADRMNALENIRQQQD